MYLALERGQGIVFQSFHANIKGIRNHGDVLDNSRKFMIHADPRYCSPDTESSVCISGPSGKVEIHGSQQMEGSISTRDEEVARLGEICILCPRRRPYIPLVSTFSRPAYPARR